MSDRRQRPPRGRGLDRRSLLSTGAVLAAGALGAPLLNLGRVLLAADGLTVSTRAVDLVAASTVVDMLGLMTMDWAKLERWYRQPSSFDLAEFRALEATGVDVVHPAVEPAFTDPAAGVRWWLRGWASFLASQPCFLARVGGVADLVRLPAAGKVGVLIGFQSSNHIQNLADVALFRQLGQQLSQLTYNGHSRLGSGCLVPDRGLTAFGAEVVAEMNRTGMAVDVSHCGDRTSLDAVGASSRPVLATHANCRALVPGQARNKPDAVIQRLARSGGVIGITLVRSFVGRGAPSLADVLDHVDHVARLVGVEHVGLGSDVAADAVDPASGRPLPAYAIRGLDLRTRVFQIADGLLARGWLARDVALVLGGNFLRALADIWADEAWEPAPDPAALRRDPFCPPRLQPTPAQSASPRST